MNEFWIYKENIIIFCITSTFFLLVRWPLSVRRGVFLSFPKALWTYLLLQQLTWFPWLSRTVCVCSVCVSVSVHSMLMPVNGRRSLNGFIYEWNGSGGGFEPRQRKTERAIEPRLNELEATGNRNSAWPPSLLTSLALSLSLSHTLCVCVLCCCVFFKALLGLQINYSSLICLSASVCIV